MTNAITDRDISQEAQKFLAKAPEPSADRTAENLPSLRAETRDYIAPSVARALQTHRVITDTIEMGGIPCLRVLPANQKVEWPILYGFGGGFVTGSPFEDLTIAAPLCAMTCAPVIIPDYRLAPENPWPAAIEDGFKVYKAIADEPFALAGESAGGNFALSLMLRAKLQGKPLPGAVALLSPWCDLTNSGDSLTTNDGRDPSIRTEHVNAAAKHYAGQHELTDADISPINGTYDETFPPCFISTGTRDLLLSQSISLADVMKAGGISVELQIWEGLWHVFEWENHLPESSQSMEQISAFLKQHMPS